MSKRASLGLMAMHWAAVLAACGAQSNASVITPFTPCLAGALDTGGQGDCNTCLEGNCQTEGHAFDRQCTDYVNCVCTDGQSPDLSMLEQCAPMLSAAECKQAFAALQTCSQSSCANQCAGPTPDAASQSDGGSSGDAAMGGEDTGAVTFSCSNGSATMMECDQQKIPPSTASEAQGGCTQIGGTPGDGCPVADLAGCCLLSTTENCYYDPVGASQRQATCQAAGGSWSAMP